MKFAYSIVYVEDVEKTLNFYQQAFHLSTHFLHESKQYGELNTGDTKLAFASNEMAKMNGLTIKENAASELAPGFEIALSTSEVKQAFEHAVQHGALSVKAPQIKPWGQEVAYVRDLNGILIELCSPMNS